MPKTLTKAQRIKEIDEAIGDPHEVDRELQEFKKSALVLSSEAERLIDRYSKLWVAIYDGRVQAEAATMEEVLEQVKALGLPQEQTLVRLIDRNHRTFVL